MALGSSRDSIGADRQPIEMLSTSGTRSENYEPDQCGSENIVSNAQDLETPPQGLQSEPETPEPRSNWKIFATMLALSVCFSLNFILKTLLIRSSLRSLFPHLIRPLWLLPHQRSLPICIQRPVMYGLVVLTSSPMPPVPTFGPICPISGGESLSSSQPLPYSL